MSSVSLTWALQCVMIPNKCQNDRKRIRLLRVNGQVYGNLRNPVFDVYKHVFTKTIISDHWYQYAVWKKNFSLRNLFSSTFTVYFTSQHIKRRYASRTIQNPTFSRFTVFYTQMIYSIPTHILQIVNAPSS
jgi:hypothetical protein